MPQIELLSRAAEDFQFPPRLFRLFRLHAGQQSIRIGALVGHNVLCARGIVSMVNDRRAVRFHMPYLMPLHDRVTLNTTYKRGPCDIIDTDGNRDVEHR